MRPVVLSGLLLAALSSAASTLEEDFARPPRHARPQTWWHWVNNCVNPAAMRVELAAMADAGLGGVHLFNAGYTASMPDWPATPFLSEAWKDALRTALADCRDLGLDFTAQNGAGWSGSGGPWIAPSNGMLQVRCAEVRVAGGQEAVLPRPDPSEWPLAFPAKAPRWYGDVAALAFPVPEACLSEETNLVRSVKVRWCRKKGKRARVRASDDGRRWRTVAELDAGEALYEYENDAVDYALPLVRDRHVKVEADGGAVAYIGASIESLSDRNQQFISGNVTSITQDINQSNYAPALIGSLYHSRAASNDGFKVRTAGGTLQAGFRYLQSVGSSQDGTLKRNVLYTIEIYNLIGDPTYMPYTEAPQKAAIKVSGTVMKGRNFSVSTAPFAQVALTSNDEAIIAVGYADDFGQLTLSVPKECDRHSALLYAIAPNYTGSSVEIQIADESGSASQDATLKTLTVSGAAVDLREGVFEHDIQVAYENNPAVIFAEASSPAAKVTGGGSKYLKLGENKVLITVTSESGNKQAYTLNITRKASALSNNYYLKTLEIFNSASEELPLDGVFDKTAWQFSVHAKRNDTITIRARTEDESAVCWFDGDDEKKAADSFEKTLTGISKYSSGGISHTIYVRTAFGEKKAFGLTVYRD